MTRIVSAELLLLGKRASTWILLGIWAVTSYGVLPLLAWAGRRTSTQLPAYLNLIVRALPLLLLFTLSGRALTGRPVR